MALKRKNINEDNPGYSSSIDIENELQNQFTNEGEIEEPIENKEVSASQYIGQKLTHQVGGMIKTPSEESKDFAEKHGLSKIGEKISDKAEFREGWIDFNRNLLGDRNIFYPEDWEFRIKPATVEAIRNWSAIDEKNPNSVDNVFDEILKACLSIHSSSRGPLPWHSINIWDRFFFVLIIREYTFANGEHKISFTRECPNCETNVEFNLKAMSLLYDIPDFDIINNYYDRETRTWNIIPEDFDVVTPHESITLYLPTREKDATLKTWMIAQLQEDQNKKFDSVFMKFLPWMIQKISKDTTIANTQVKKAQMEFKSWNLDMFSFMNNVIDNITVSPSSNLITNCASCGEEVTAPIQFPDGISALFSVAGKFKKFGKK